MSRHLDYNKDVILIPFDSWPLSTDQHLCTAPFDVAARKVQLRKRHAGLQGVGQRRRTLVAKLIVAQVRFHNGAVRSKISASSIVSRLPSPSELR